MNRGRRHLKILMLVCVGCLPVGLGNLWSQGPGGPFRGPRPSGPPGPMGMPLGEGSPAARFEREQEGYRRMQQLAPEERETFKHNLEMWHNLPPDERVALRNLAHARARVEIDKAIQDSGLHLDPDQREMFALRYTQERRKLERELQRQVNAERAQRMPEILARLKSEFGPGPSTAPAGKPAAASPAAEARPEANGSPASNPAPAR